MLLKKQTLLVLSALMLASAGPIQAQQSISTDWNKSMTFQFGVDAWHLRSSTQEDVFNGPQPQDWNMSHSMLGLPSSMTTWDYNPVSPWYKFQGSVSPLRNLVFSTKFQANQTLGFRIDELSADYALSEFLGFRAGIVDYKLSWCSAYDTQSPWIFEPNMFCGMKYTTSVTGGAPGAQTYFNNKYGDYRFQALAGVYLPNTLNYDTKDFGNYVLDGSPQKNDKNLKYGLSFNLLNVQSGTQLRLSWVHGDQHATSDLYSTGQQRSDMTYAGLEMNLAPRLNLRLSRTDYFGSIRTQDQFDPEYSWNGVLSNVHFSNSTVELRYLVNQSNMFALAYTLYQYNIDNQDLPVALVEGSGIWGDGYFALNRQQVSASWRHDWDSGLFSIAQVSYTDLINGYNGARYKANSLAAGLRVGFTF